MAEKSQSRRSQTTFYYATFEEEYCEAKRLKLKEIINITTKKSKAQKQLTNRDQGDN